MSWTHLSLLGLGTLGLALAAAAFATARRQVTEILCWDGYLDRWRDLHGGYDPRAALPVTRGWLRVVYVLSGPLARRGIQPHLLTVSATWLAAAVLVPAQAGGRWALLAAAMLVASGLFDSLDGCVAVLEDRTTRWGYVLDSAVDRVNDCLFLVALVAVGAPGGLAVLCGTLCFLLEYVRARAGNVGGDEVGRITIGERPNRVIVLAASLLSCGVFVDQAPGIATAGVSVLTLLSALAVVQLAVTVHRQLAEGPHQAVTPDRSDPPRSGPTA